MVPGLALALGTTQLWIAADAILVTYVVLEGPKAFKTHWIILAIAAIFALSGIWSPDPLASALAAGRVILLYSAARSVRSPRVWYGVLIVLGAQLSIVAYQLTFLERPHGLSVNASQLGQAGMAFMYGPAAPVAALTLGASIARAPMLGLAFIMLFRRTRYAWAMAGLAAMVFVAVTVWKAPERISPSGINEGLEQRAANAEGVPIGDAGTAAELLGACGVIREREWSWHGYGYHGYCLSTGQQRPHNFLLLTWWDLGIFAVPLWGLVAIGAWKTRRPEWLGLLAVAMITEELYGRPEGTYMIAAIAMLPEIPRPRLAWHWPGLTARAKDRAT